MTGDDFPDMSSRCRHHDVHGAGDQHRAEQGGGWFAPAAAILAGAPEGRSWLQAWQAPCVWPQVWLPAQHSIRVWSHVLSADVHSVYGANCYFDSCRAYCDDYQHALQHLPTLFA